MDTKTKLVNDLKKQLYTTFTVEQLSIMEQALYARLSEYDVSERCTEIAIRSSPALEALKHFAIAKHLQGLSPASIRRYYYICYPLLDTLGKSLPEISAFDVRAYLLRYKARHDVSNRTLDGMRLCFSSFFSWCLDENLISKSPCDSIPQIKYDKTIPLPFTAIEMEKVKRACKSKRDRAIVETLYATGCRVTELSKLNRSDIDFQTHSARVTGKGGKERTVYFTDVALFYLSEYLEQRADTLPALFIGRGTERLTKDGIEKLLQRLGKRAGVQKVHPHRYRRTLATNLLDRDTDIQYVATVLGHENINTTKIYGYITQQNVATAYNRCIS